MVWSTLIKPEVASLAVLVVKGIQTGMDKLAVDSRTYFVLIEPRKQSFKYPEESKFAEMELFGVGVKVTRTTADVEQQPESSVATAVRALAPAGKLDHMAWQRVEKGA